VIASVTLLSLSLELSAPEKAATAMPKLSACDHRANQLNQRKTFDSALAGAHAYPPAREESEVGLFVINLRIFLTIRLIARRVHFRRPF
jgi:hypothetical protein